MTAILNFLMSAAIDHVVSAISESGVVEVVGLSRWNSVDISIRSHVISASVFHMSIFHC